MEMAYLGLFQKVFNWVLKKIFDPVFKWLSRLLTTVFNWIFDEILSKTLIDVLESVLSWAFELLKTIFGGLIYGIFSKLLKLIDYMEKAFDVLIGISSVTYTDPVTEAKTSGSLLEVLFQQETINTLFWLLTMSGLTLAMIFTVYGTAKSTFDLDFENKRPVSKVLTSMFQAFIQFFSVPFLSYFMIRLSAEILGSISNLLNGGGTASVKTTLGRIVFMISSLNAALPVEDSEKKMVEYNLSKGDFGFPLGTSEKDVVRYPFYALNADSPKDYGSISAVRESFDLAKFDYLIGFIAAIFLFIILAVCLITFVQRIFELILLYIVSPYFVSMMPLDDGERFSKWRELFIAKCFTGFGSAIGMRLYLMVCPMVMGGTISFTDQSSPEMNYLIKLFFLAGGAWAVYKSGPMLTQLLSFQAAQSESMTQAAAAGAIYATANRTVAMGSSIYHKHQEKKKKEQEQAERAFNQRMNSGGMGGSGAYGQSGYMAAAEGGKWSMLTRLSSAHGGIGRNGRDGKDGRDGRNGGNGQSYNGMANREYHQTNQNNRVNIRYNMGTAGRKPGDRRAEASGMKPEDRRVTASGMRPDNRSAAGMGAADMRRSAGGVQGIGTPVSGNMRNGIPNSGISITGMSGGVMNGAGIQPGGISGTRRDYSDLAAKKSAVPANRYVSSDQPSPILYSKPSIQKNLVINEQRMIRKNLVINEQRTIRTEVVMVRKTEERTAPNYSRYSQMAHAATRPGTGGYRA